MIPVPVATSKSDTKHGLAELCVVTAQTRSAFGVTNDSSFVARASVGYVPLLRKIGQSQAVTDVKRDE